MQPTWRLITLVVMRVTCVRPVREIPTGVLSPVVSSY